MGTPFALIRAGLGLPSWCLGNTSAQETERRACFDFVELAQGTVRTRGTLSFISGRPSWGRLIASLRADSAVSISWPEGRLVQR